MSHPPKPTAQFHPFADIRPFVSHPCPPPAKDGRTQALELFLAYISNLKFFKPGENGEAVSFCVPEANTHLDPPDYDTDFKLPAMVILAGKNTPEPNGLTPILIAGSEDRYCLGTAVHIHDEHNEIFTLELWTAYKSEIRALTAGLEQAFQPSDGQTGVMFYMRNYYDTSVIFTFLSSQIAEDPDTQNNKRRATVEVHMRFNVTTLEPYNTLKPFVSIDVE